MDAVPCDMNNRFSLVSFALISLHTSSTFFKRVRSFWMKAALASGCMVLSSEVILSAASLFL